MKVLEGVSFVIPARNEQENIAITIEAIRTLNLRMNYEIIVVDHLSTDSTGSVASAAGAQVLNFSGQTIGAARNYGAAQAIYDIIVFIDADVSLTIEWNQEIYRVLKKMRENTNFISGSHCSAPKDGSFIEKHWFNNFSKQKNSTHLGTGHLIVSKDFFHSINGFNETLITGEDYDFCIRAKSAGAVLENTPELIVIHRDFPKTIAAFIRREIWHGKGDGQTFSSVIRSKVALVSIVFLSLHIAIIWGMLLTNLELIFSTLILLLSILLLSSLYKFKSTGFKTILINAFVFYIYYLGRSASLIMGLLKI